MLDLSCSVPGTPSANFTIQKEDRVLSRYQNFSKFAEERDSGKYICTAAIGKVVKRSNSVQIKVCGEYVPSCSAPQWLGRNKEWMPSCPWCIPIC